MAKSKRAEQAPPSALSGNAPEIAAMPDIPVAAVFSFLKDMRGALTWTLRDLTRTLAISQPDALKVLSILKMQGYVSETGENEFLTTASGEVVSGSKPPRFRRECVDGAVSKLFDRIAAINRDRHAPFKISEALAFGDFLSDRPNCQSADVGIELTPRESADRSEKFLKLLGARNLFLNIRRYEPWMSKRAHRRLL